LAIINSRDESNSIMPTTPEIPAIAGRPATVKKSGTKETPAIVSMPATQKGCQQQQ
jgi:hypothetical protein